MEQSGAELLTLFIFAFSATVLVALFTWMSVAKWISARAADRRMRERYALFKHLSEQTAGGAQLVLDRLREDDAREDERARASTHLARRSKLEGAGVLMAAGAGVATFLYYLGPDKPVWLIGVIPLIIGAVLAAFAIVELSRTRSEPGH